MRIGITDCYREDKFALYVGWLRSAMPHADLITLSGGAVESPAIEQLDGVVLTGGGDVHPKFFGEEQLMGRCKGVDAGRDEFELDVIDRALDAELPILGVCRGMQIMNVFLGGTLHTDLEQDGFQDHASPANGPAQRHPVAVVPHSLLHLLTGGALELEVNSFHHQAVRKLGNALVATAITADGVIEAAEWAVKADMPFLMLVQWHPEREATNSVSTNLAALFAREVLHAKQQKTTN